jgi:hypothetical protein
MAAFPGIDRKFNLFCPMALLSCSRINLIIIVFSSINIRYNSNFFPGENKASKIKIFSILSSAVIKHLNRCSSLEGDDCISTGESAAVFGFSLQKAVKSSPHLGPAAAGLLFYWSLGGS